jgi:hypothetical protein
MSKAGTVRIFVPLGALLLGVAALLVWDRVCQFPDYEWNNVRLRPSFLIADGRPLYETADRGPISTWVYGPVYPLLLLPATLAGDLSTALLAAAGLNAALLAGSLAVFCLAWPADAHVPGGVRLAAFGVALLLVPGGAFIFLQADNAVFAFGLLGMLALARARGAAGGAAWLAAICAILAAGSKQPALLLAPAQVAWALVCHGRGAAARQAGRLGAVALLGLGGLLAVGELPGFWFKTVALAGRFPLHPDPLGLVLEYAPLLLGYVGLLALAGLLARRTRDQALLLALFSAAVLPLGLLASLGSGGRSNSLNGYALLVAPLSLFALAALERGVRAGTASAWLVATCAATFAVWAATSCTWPPRRPDLKAVRESQELAARFPGAIWFPWSPLATYYADHRHDHDEDGLHVRQLTGRYPSRARAGSDLPPRWRVTALRRVGMDWGVARAMHREKPTVFAYYGEWVLLMHPEAPPAAP